MKNSQSEQEFKNQCFYYEDADGSIRKGYDTEEEMVAMTQLFSHEYRAEDFGEFCAQYEPKTWQKITVRLIVCAAAVLSVVAVWFVAAGWFGFELIN